MGLKIQAFSKYGSSKFIAKKIQENLLKQAPKIKNLSVLVAGIYGAKPLDDFYKFKNQGSKLAIFSVSLAPNNMAFLENASFKNQIIYKKSLLGARNFDTLDLSDKKALSDFYKKLNKPLIKNINLIDTKEINKSCDELLQVLCNL